MLKKSCSPTCCNTGSSKEEMRHLVNPIRVALVGNANTGKTTLFNALTGLRHRVANYPGITVEKRWGLANHSKIRMEVLDLPGVNSLEPRSLDEKVVHDVLVGAQQGTQRPQVIIALADPFYLQKNLYLVSQIKALGIPVVLALNFMDEARKKRFNVDVKKLQQRLEIPVTAISALHKEGLSALRESVAAAAEKTASGDDAIRPAPPPQDSAAIYAWVEDVINGIFTDGIPKRDFTARVDGVLLHPVAGPLALTAIMFLVFQSIFSWATIPMDAIIALFDGAGAWVHGHISNKLLAGFLADGVLAGVGSVLTFLPQIVLLFLFIGLLEDTGYLARAAFLLDRIMSKVGLNGKAFLPLFSCFACAIPGIMATRVIENRRERLSTILVAPFMTCSARIPVYALVTAALIPAAKVFGFLNLQALVFFGLYVLGIVTAAVMAKIFMYRLPTKDSSHFFLELPPYRLPHLRTMFTHVWERSGAFVKRAGTIILLVSVVLWAISTFPRPSPGVGNADALKNSIAGRAGQLIEPAIKPLGFDWKVGIGILVSFAQRELFVSTMAVLNNVGLEDEGSTALQTTLREQKDPVTGKPLYPPLVGVSILLFYALACQCISTLAIVRKETGTWRWPLFMFAYMTALAYLVSLAVYQGGKLLGLA